MRSSSDDPDAGLWDASCVARALLDRGSVTLEHIGNSQKRLAHINFHRPSSPLEEARLTRRFLQRKVAEYD